MRASHDSERLGDPNAEKGVSVDKRRGAWVCVGKEEGLPDLAGQPGSSQAGCFLPWLTPHPGAGPRQGSEEGQGVGSTTCCRKISARGQEVITGLPRPLGCVCVLRVFGRFPGAPDSYLRVSRPCTNYLKVSLPPQPLRERLP